MGSNIEPQQNIPAAISLLKVRTRLVKLSSIWITPSVGSPGPDFQNVAALIVISMDAASLKQKVLREIERELGRTRCDEKNAPRSVDLDIILFDGVVMDPDVWKQAHVALPVSELCPELFHPENRIPLITVAAELRLKSAAVRHAGIRY